jgi:hypothetical protein
MAVLSINIPDAQVNRVATAFIAAYPPPEGVPVGTAAEKGVYVKSLLVAHIMNVVRSHEAAVAAETARAAAAATADTEVTPT